jgi:hypothetical protein
MKVFKSAVPSLNDAIAQLSQNVYTKVDAASGAGSVTLTVDQFVNGIYVQADGGAAANKTTPTAAAIVAGIKGCKVGTCFSFMLRNEDAADAMTVVGGTGVTVKGTATVAATKNSIWVGYVVSVTASSEAVHLFQVGVA